MPSKETLSSAQSIRRFLARPELTRADLLRLRTQLLADQEREELLSSFAKYIPKAWALVDPAPLLWGRHIEAIAEHLQAVTEGKIRKLIINIPPGHAKSMLVSVLWPTWAWARRPEWRLLCASYGDLVILRDAVKARTILNTDWYVNRFRSGFTDATDTERPAWALKLDQNNKGYYENTCGGFRISLTPNGQGTGLRGDALIVDDPLNAMDATSKVERENVIRWKTETMSSRFNDLASAVEVIIMQRLHEDDLTGFLLRNARNEYEHLCLPSEFESKRAYRTSIGRDWRTEEGEVLFPEKFPKKVLEDAKKPGTGMGSLAYAGQHQQSPAPAEGNLIKRAWFNKRWRRKDEKAPEGSTTVILPDSFEELILVCDATFKDTKKSDRVAIGIMGRKGPDKYLLEMAWDRMGMLPSLQAIRDLNAGAKKKWGKTLDGIYIEDKANGSAIIEVLKQSVARVIPLEPGKDSKESRIGSVTGEMQGGNFILPQDASWTGAFIEEAVSFPKGSYDDAIDMAAYGLLLLSVSSAALRFRKLAKM